jgi:hypothetical protein
MVERRRNKRVLFRTAVRLGPDRPPEYTSLSTDLSYPGIGMKTYWAFEPGTTLYLLIDGVCKRYGAEGVVVWSKRLRPGVVQLETTGMGIKFTYVDNELFDLYEQKASS